VCDKRKTVQQRRRIYKQAVALIVRDYANELSIDDVAQPLFCSRRQLQRVFFDHGTTFRSLCRRVRMKAARGLLRNEPAMTVREVARAVGYLQPAQFAKAFRREVGVGPSEYRTRTAGRNVGPPPDPSTHPPEFGSRALVVQSARVRESRPPSLESLLGLTG
jgi:AraC-like DNA-binding protein